MTPNGHSGNARAQLDAFIANPTADAGSMPLVDHLLEIPAAPGMEAFIRALPTSPQFQVVDRVFSMYPPNSLLRSAGRALLFNLIRYSRPEQVVEIGTYQAGTAEVMARALHANGKGTLTTIDPFPVVAAPLIALWPQELKDRVNFFHGDSMGFFLELEGKSRQGVQLALDIVFIDGHHDFEYALFDLSMSARHIRPGGIIVMDNAELTGVFWAVKQFLRLNPAWREIGSAMAEHSDSAPFQSMGRSFPDTDFLILQAPQGITFGKVPTSFLRPCPELDQCAGMQLSFTAAEASGVLHLRAFLRAFYHHELGKFPDQVVANVSHRIKAGETDCRIVFEAPIGIPRHDGEVLRHLELLAIWQPDSGLLASILRPLILQRYSGTDTAGLELNCDPEAFSQ